jgi:hypothetical protein
MLINKVLFILFIHCVHSKLDSIYYVNFVSNRPHILPRSCLPVHFKFNIHRMFHMHNAVWFWGRTFFFNFLNQSLLEMDERIIEHHIDHDKTLHSINIGAIVRSIHYILHASWPLAMLFWNRMDASRLLSLTVANK